MREPEPLATRLHGRVVKGAFRPHPLFAGPHAQTLLTMLRRSPKVELRIERRELPDGDFVDLGWCSNGHAALPGAPLAILLHGMTGGFDSKYVRGTARQLLARGWRVVVLQFRGAGPEPNRLPHGFHHGQTEDLRELVQLLRAREPETRLYAVGWSMGGNVLLKYLGEEGDGTALTAAAAVSVPFQLKPCAERLRTGFSRIYQNHLLTELKSMIKRKHERVQLEIDLAKVASAKDFFDFDNAATALLNGFRDAEDYYTRAACGQYLGGIARTTLILHARDDPFMVPSIVPEASQLSPAVTLELCDHGGHLGFAAAGPGLSVQWWLEGRIPEFLESQRK